MEFSGRLKDYYDIYYLSNKFDFDNDGAMHKKWKAFVRKIDTKTDVYRTVLKSIKAITSIISRHRP